MEFLLRFAEYRACRYRKVSIFRSRSFYKVIFHVFFRFTVFDFIHYVQYTHTQNDFYLTIQQMFDIEIDDTH